MLLMDTPPYSEPYLSTLKDIGMKKRTFCVCSSQSRQHERAADLHTQPPYDLWQRTRVRHYTLQRVRTKKKKLLYLNSIFGFGFGRNDKF